MRKSTGDLVWDFIVLCNDRRCPKQLHEYEKFIHHCSDKSVIEAICEYQLSLSREEFLATGFQAMSCELQATERSHEHLH
jgi:hypothetical protein